MASARFSALLFRPVVLLVLLPVLSGTSSGAEKFRILYSFPAAGTQGSFPNGPVTLDAKGNFYGVTASGGDYKDCTMTGCGVVYELSPVSGHLKEAVLHTFDWYDDGEVPMYNLVLDPQGDLYGVVTDGPPGYPYGYNGAVFELTPESNGKWSLTLLYKIREARPLPAISVMRTAISTATMP
jgi:hypothetical protein